MTQTLTPTPSMTPLPTLATHWQVRPETARAILAAHGMSTIVRGGRRYVAWADVIKIEGTPPLQASEADLQAPLLTRDEVAERYGIAPRTARRWLSLGHLPVIRLAPRILRARRADLDVDDARRLEAA